MNLNNTIPPPELKAKHHLFRAFSKLAGVRPVPAFLHFMTGSKPLASELHSIIHTTLISNNIIENSKSKNIILPQHMCTKVIFILTAIIRMLKYQFY